MPFYRVNGMTVHIKLSGKGAKNPPAPCCAPVPNDTKPSGTMHCRGISAFLCDWENSDGKTCDAPLCPEHATEVGKNRHLCPLHLVQHRAAAPELF